MDHNSSGDGLSDTARELCCLLSLHVLVSKAVSQDGVEDTGASDVPSPRVWTVSRHSALCRAQALAVPLSLVVVVPGHSQQCWVFCRDKMSPSGAPKIKLFH